MVKDYTKEMKAESFFCDKLASRVEALKARSFFISTSRIASAILAKKVQDETFWKLVSETWPETKGMNAQMRKDHTIVFTEYK